MKKKTMLKTILTLLTCSLVMASCNSGNTAETSSNTSSAVSVENSESELSSEQPESSAEADSQEEEQGFVLAYPEHMQSMGFTESLELEKEPETIVCLSTYPVQTLMGMGVELAAVPTTKVIEYPADYSGTILPAIMNDNFDLEQVIAMEPDLVILPNSAQEKYGATLESLEIPVYYIAMTSSGFSAYDVIRQQTAVFTEAFGTDTDRQTKGKEILSRFDTLDAELAAFSEKTEGMSVFAITVSGDQIYTTSSTSTLGCMLELCGLENVFQPDASNGGHSLGTLDMETSISYDPDIMVICGSSTKEDNIAMMQALYEKNPSYWDAIDAYKEGRIIYLPSSYVSTAGINIIDNIRNLMGDLETLLS